MATAKGSFKRHYFTTQSAYATSKIPAATSAVKLTSALLFSQADEAAALDEFHPSTRSPDGEVIGARTTGVTANLNVKGSGTQGTAPDFTDMLETAFTLSTTVATTVAASPAPTTSTFKLTADNLAADQMGFIRTTAGENKHFMVTAKDAGTKVLTIFPPLVAAPTALDNVDACCNYNLNLTNTEFCTAQQSDNVSGEIGWGIKFGKWTWNFKRGEKATMTAEGIARNSAKMVHTTLSAGIDNATTTVPVVDQGNEVGAVLICDTEAMLVTAVDATGLSLTVERDYDGTSAASHLIAAPIGPSEPTETTAGSVIRGLEGGLYIANMAGTGRLVKADDITISDDEHILPVTYFGDGGVPADMLFPADREVSWSATLQLDSETAEFLKQCKDASGVKVFLQAGNAGGLACAFYSPSVTFDIPQIPDGKGDLIRVPIASRSVLSTSGENAFAFAF